MAMMVPSRRGQRAGRCLTIGALTRQSHEDVQAVA